MNMNFFADMFRPTTSQQNPTPGAPGMDGPKSQGMNRGVNDPASNQGKFEEVKARQGAPVQGNQNAFGGAGNWLQKNLGGFGGSNILSYAGQGTGGENLPKNYTTCLTYMNHFQGKSVIITGATGGIGSKVAKRLLKAGKIQSSHFYRSTSCHVCSRSN